MAGTQKTQPTGADVEAFLEAVPNADRRADARALCTLLAELTREPPVLWGSSIVGFGTYVKRLADIDLDVLRELVTRSVKVHRGQDRTSAAG